MESISYFKNLKISPKKLRFLMPQIKKMSPADAMKMLYYTQSKPARVFYKAIQSAVTNAKQTLKVTEDLIQFKLLTIEEGQRLKRFRAGGRGTAKPYARKFAHVKIVLHTPVQPLKQEETAKVEKQITKEVEKAPKKKAPVKNKTKTEEKA